MKRVLPTTSLCLILLVTANMGCRPSTPAAPQGDTSPAAGTPAPTADSAGPSNGQSNGQSSDAAQATAEPAQATADAGPIALPEVIEIKADALLSAQLTAEQLDQGWVRLFDGHTLFGWFVVGTADWQIADEGIIRVTRGERSFLCTSFQLPDYELQLEFRSDPETNSGIFLRTGPEPQDVAVGCLELNIAPPDNPFPTGSFVQRQKLEPSELGEFDPQQWHTYRVRVAGNQVEVWLDDRQIMQLEDLEVAPTGHISLQYNSGRVEFRNVLLRPLEPRPLQLGDDWQEDWTHSEKEPDTFHVSVEPQGLHLVGGLGQLQSKDSFGNFFLQARYRLAKPEVNSGIFFRCVPESMLDGYECQVNHAVVDGDPLRPQDAGAGAIFRRQPARIVVGDGTAATHLSLLANGPQIVTWVNGGQVADFVDTRPADENPRRGLRTEPGPIALQGHDPTTDVTFEQLKIAPLEP